MRVEQRRSAASRATNLPPSSRPALDRLRGESHQPSCRRIRPRRSIPACASGEQIDGDLAGPWADDAAMPPRRMQNSSGWSACRPIRHFQRRYPHQLSGGQQQRVCIAMALACDPDLVGAGRADDGPRRHHAGADHRPCSAICARRIGMSMLYVTHDLALLSQIADRVGVMYAGRMVEIAPTARSLRRRAIPIRRASSLRSRHRRAIRPARPRPLRGLLRRERTAAGCPFAPRCDHATDRCCIREARSGADRRASCRRLLALAGDRAASRRPGQRPMNWPLMPIARPCCRWIRSASSTALAHAAFARSGACLSRSRTARSLLWSANPAAASRRWRAPSAASLRRKPAASACAGSRWLERSSTAARSSAA